MGIKMMVITRQNKYGHSIGEWHSQWGSQGYIIRFNIKCKEIITSYFKPKFSFPKELRISIKNH